MIRNGAPLVLAALGIFAVQTASAHRINILILPEGTHIRGEVYYSDGKPAAGSPVTVTRAGGSPVSLTTDSHGRFSFAPQAQDTYTFVVETADGHRAEATFEPGLAEVDTVANGSAPSSSQSVNANALREIVQHELAPLREQLDSYEHATRFRDILGGIGYIVGIVGVAAWWKARRRVGCS